MRLRTLIVDDEPLDRERIKRFLRDEAEIEVIGECGNGTDAIAAIKKGDEVVTGGGIRGRVTKVTDDEAEVEIAQGVKVRVVKGTLSQVLTKSAKPAND